MFTTTNDLVILHLNGKINVPLLFEKDPKKRNSTQIENRQLFVDNALKNTVFV